MAGAVTVPVKECVGEALRFAADNIRSIAAVSAAGALVLTVLAGLTLLAGPLGLAAGLATTFVRAAIYAMFIAAMLFGVHAVRARAVSDAWQVWAAMALLGLFLFIVMFVVSIPGMIVLLAGPLAPYIGDLQSAGEDQGQILQVMLRFAQEEPLAVLLFTLFYAAVWLLLTSRLYLAAPASVEARRVLVFETWGWTRGAVLAVTWARLMLLGPAYVLVSALDYIVARLFGVNAFDLGASLAQTNQIGFLGYVFVTSLIAFAIYASLEAGLSTSLFRTLRQQPPTGLRLDQVIKSD
ncbi:MAG: hypothetical protein AB7T59_03800 [Hyphomonadaceae bacterium]